MKLNKSRYVMNCIIELVISGRIIVGILAAIIPAILMMNFILNKGANAAFYIKHISNFFCMLGLYVGVLNSLYFVSRDFTYNTISLIGNSSYNRKSYLLGNIILSLLVSIIYSIVGVSIVLIAHHLGVPGELGNKFLIGFAINVVLTIIFYTLLGYLLFYYGLKTSGIYILVTVLLLFVPSIASNILVSIDKKVIVDIVEKIPFYSLPIYAGSNMMSGQQYLVVLICGAFIFYLTLKKCLSCTYN